MSKILQIKKNKSTLSYFWTLPEVKIVENWSGRKTISFFKDEESHCEFAPSFSEYYPRVFFTWDLHDYTFAHTM